MDSFSCCSPLNTSFIVEKLKCDMVTSFYHYNDVRDRRATSVQLFVLYFSLGLVRVCEIEIYHMGKNNRKSQSGVICEKRISITG